MKKHILLLLLTFLSLQSFAQNNAIKGRIGIVPGFDFEGLTYGGGIAYERLIKKHWSFQFLFNAYHLPSDRRLTFQSNGFFSTLESNNHEFIPEVRYYFGKKENYRSNSFVGAYANFRFKKSNEFNFFGDFDDLVIEKIQDRCLGLVIGQNLPIAKRLFLDVYIGGSYNFETLYLNNGTVKQTNKQVRVGLNLGYLF